MCSRSFFGVEPGVELFYMDCGSGDPLVFVSGWTVSTRSQSYVQEDKNAALIAETLMKLIEDKSIRIPRGGYQVTRGRGRVIVEQAKG